MRIAPVLFASTLVAALFVSLVPQASSAGGSGQELFASAKCQTCHGVSAAGVEAKVKKGPMAGPDLSNIKESRDAEWIAKFVTGKESKDGSKHKKLFKGSDEDLQAIIGWLFEQAE